MTLGVKFRRLFERLAAWWRGFETKKAVVGPRIVHYFGVRAVDSQADAAEAARSMMLAVVKGTGGPKWVVFTCPCGCDQVRRVSLSPAMRPAWRAEMNAKNELSLFPSVWLQSECRAHFILRDNVATMI